MWLLGLTVAKEEMQENREMYFHIWRFVYYHDYVIFVSAISIKEILLVKIRSNIMSAKFHEGQWVK